MLFECIRIQFLSLEPNENAWTVFMVNKMRLWYNSTSKIFLIAMLFENLRLKNAGSLVYDDSLLSAKNLLVLIKLEFAFSFVLLAEFYAPVYVFLHLESMLQDWTGFSFREIMDDVEKIKGTVYLLDYLY